MRITKISLENFKGVTAQFDIGERNLIVGPMGVGKTAILQAIQWAIEGRTACGGTLEATAQLAGVTGCQVSIRLDDGFEWSRQLCVDNREHKLSERITIHGAGLTGKSAKAAIVEHVGKNGELFAPMFDLHDFLDLSQDKRRDFVMDLCGRASDGEVPLDVLEQIVHEFYMLALGEGTVGDKANAALLPKLSHAQQLALATIADAMAMIRERANAVESLGAAAEAVREIALRSKKTKDEARQAARRLADEKTAASIIAENLDALELRLATAQSSIGEIGEQVANQAGRVSARGSLARTIELNQLKMRNLVAMPEYKIDDAALADAETQIAAIEGRAYGIPNIEHLRTKAAELTAALGDARRKESDVANRIDALKRTKARLQADVGELRGSPWLMIARKLDLALKCVMSVELRNYLDTIAADIRIENANKLTRIHESEVQLTTVDSDLSEAETLAATALAKVQMLTVLSADAEAIATAAYAEQAHNDAERGREIRELEVLRRKTDGLRQIKMHREVREREIKTAQDAMLDAQRQLDQLDAEGGFVPVADLESQRAGLIEQVASIKTQIAAKRRAMATDEQLTKCLASAEQDEVLHATAEMMRDAIRVVRESLMVELVKPLLGHIELFLSATMGRLFVPYCRLEKDNDTPIFELGWHVGDRRVSEPALSGGERAIFGAALAYALIRLADPPLKLLMIEGAELDDVHSEALLRALTTLPGIDSVLLATWHAELFAGADDWNEIRLPTAGMSI